MSAKEPPQRGLIGEITCAATATSLACIFSNPMEVVKTRMQMQGELLSRGALRAYRNALHCFYTIVRDEGLKGIQRGLGAGMVYQVIMNGSRLGFYTPIKRAYGVEAEGRSEAGRFMASLAAGATTGSLGGLLGSPIFLVKARLQNSGNAAGRFSYNYTGMADGLRQVYKQEGVRGLFRGVEGSILRVMVGSAAQLSSYDTAKRYVQWTGWVPDGVATHMTASLAAGLVVTTAMNPFDVVSTRLFSQQVTESGGALYKSGLAGPIDCMAKIYRAEGLFGFYKGWSAHYLRLGPHTVLTFVFWEQVKGVYDRATGIA